MSRGSEFLDRLLSQDYTVVDVETTGMGKGARICEIGAVRITGRIITGVFHTIVDPREPILNSGIHGVTDSMAFGAPVFESVLPRLYDFVDDSVFVAHNARFDIGMIQAEQERVYGQRPNVMWPYICSVTMGRIAFPGLSSYRLESLIAALGVVNDTPHEGLSDAYATAEAFIDLLHRLSVMGSVKTEKFIKRLSGEAPIFVDSMPVLYEKAPLKPRYKASV